MDMTRAKYADAVHKSECKSTERLAHACGRHRAHETTLHATAADAAEAPSAPVGRQRLLADSARRPARPARKRGAQRPQDERTRRPPGHPPHGPESSRRPACPGDAERGPAVIGEGLSCAPARRG
jgi:hypothetical protein